MSNKWQTWFLALCAAVLMVSAATSQAAIIEAGFPSIGSQQVLEGTTVGLTTNEPGGTWMVAAGWSWGNPYVTATWDPPGLPVDIADLAEEKTVLGLSIASSGGYTKPTLLHFSTNMEFPGSRNHTAGVGFFSVLPARANGVNQFEHFTGLYISEPNGTLQVMADGTLVDSAVSVGTIPENAFFNISYDIDTATGGLANVVFDGSPVSGLSSTGFTDPATAYAAVVVGTASRVWLDGLEVSERVNAAVPEPATMGLLALAAAGLGGYVRRRRMA